MEREWIKSQWIGYLEGGVPLCEIGDPAAGARLARYNGQLWVIKPVTPGAPVNPGARDHLRALATPEEIAQGKAALAEVGLTLELCDTVVAVAHAVGQSPDPEELLEDLDRDGALGES